MANHSSILAWRILWTEEPGRLQSMGVTRGGHKLKTKEREDGHSFSSKEQVSFNFMVAVTICSDFGAQKDKVCPCFHCFSVCHEVMGPDAMILLF